MLGEKMKKTEVSTQVPMQVHTGDRIQSYQNNTLTKTFTNVTPRPRYFETQGCKQTTNRKDHCFENSTFERLLTLTIFKRKRSIEGIDFKPREAKSDTQPPRYRLFIQAA